MFLWWMSDPDRLSSRVASSPRERPHEVAFSPVTAWELAIKSALGRVNGIRFDELAAEIEALGWSEVRFSYRHAAAVATLPFHHHDPFDRALVARCMVEDLAFVTANRLATRYPVKVLW